MAQRTVPVPEPETTAEHRLARIEAYERVGRRPRRLSRAGRLVVAQSGRVIRASYANPYIRN